jgi:hypothetical protein
MCEGAFKVRNVLKHMSFCRLLFSFPLPFLSFQYRITTCCLETKKQQRLIKQQKLQIGILYYNMFSGILLGTQVKEENWKIASSYFLSAHRPVSALLLPHGYLNSIGLRQTQHLHLAPPAVLLFIISVSGGGISINPKTQASALSPPSPSPTSVILTE